MKSFDIPPQPEIPPQADGGGEPASELARDASLDGRMAQDAAYSAAEADTPLPDARQDKELPAACAKTLGRAAAEGARLDMCGTIESIQQRMAAIEKRIEDSQSFNPFKALWNRTVLDFTGDRELLADYRSGRIDFFVCNTSSFDRSRSNNDDGADRNRSAGSR